MDGKKTLITGILVSLLYSIINTIMIIKFELTTVILVSSTFCLVISIIIINLLKIPINEINSKGLFIDFRHILIVGVSIGLVLALLNWPNVECDSKNINNYFHIRTLLVPVISLMRLIGIAYIFQAALEELVNRGLILGGLLKLSNKYIAITISTLIFAIMHINYLIHLQVYNFIVIVILGAVCAYMANEKKNITVSIIIHYYFNVTSYFLPSLVCR